MAIHKLLVWFRFGINLQYYSDQTYEIPTNQNILLQNQDVIQNKEKILRLPDFWEIVQLSQINEQEQYLTFQANKAVCMRKQMQRNYLTI